MNGQIFTIPNAAKQCGLSRGTIWNFVKSGELKAFRTPGGQYRILRHDLVDFMARKQMPPTLADMVRNNRILIVDDNVSICTMIDRILEPFGFITDSAQDGFEAGAKVFSFKPELVILDIFMPGMDCFEVCRQIKNNPATAGIKVLAITGEDSPETRERILSCGADAYMAKPLSKDPLTQQVVRLLQTNGRI